MGARAFSHDSIFIPDGGADNEQTVQAMSQDNILGKVKTLQVRQPEVTGRAEQRSPSPALWGGKRERPRSVLE